MRLFILAAAILIPACAGEGSDGAADEQTSYGAGPVVDTIAAKGKTGTYIARGSFTGGEVTDGRDVHDIEWSVHEGFERIEIRIHEAKWLDSENAPPAVLPCWFSVSREDFPARLLVVVRGTRMFSAAPPELPPATLVRGYYRIIYLDDAGSMFAFEINNDTEFEVFERHDPAVIVIDIRETVAGSRGGPETVFSLRSVSWPHGERPGHFQEVLMKAGAKKSRIIRDAKGDFYVEEGQYPTLEQAGKSQGLLAYKNIILFIEQRGTCDMPGNIPYEKK